MLVNQKQARPEIRLATRQAILAALRSENAKVFAAIAGERTARRICDVRQVGAIIQVKPVGKNVWLTPDRVYQV